MLRETLTKYGDLEAKAGNETEETGRDENKPGVGKALGKENGAKGECCNTIRT